MPGLSGIFNSSIILKTCWCYACELYIAFMFTNKVINMNCFSIKLISIQWDAIVEMLVRYLSVYQIKGPP